MNDITRFISILKYISSVEVIMTTEINDLGLDSLDYVEVIMNTEKEFDISIPDEVAEEFITNSKTVEDLAVALFVFINKGKQKSKKVRTKVTQKPLLPEVKITEGMLVENSKGKIGFVVNAFSIGVRVAVLNSEDTDHSHLYTEWAIGSCKPYYGQVILENVPD